MSDIKRGDVVTLKSGGPCMTVETVSDAEVKCRWFGEDGSIDSAVRSAEFHPDMLRTMTEGLVGNERSLKSKEESKPESHGPAKPNGR